MRTRGACSTSRGGLARPGSVRPSQPKRLLRRSGPGASLSRSGSRGALRHRGAAATLALVALAAGIALAASVALLRPEPVAVVAGLVLSRYVAFGLFLRSCVRLARAQAAVAGDPTRADLYFELAFARLERGRVGDAVRAFRQGVGLDPELDMDRPAQLTERLLLRKPVRGQRSGRVGRGPGRRKALVYLITAALFDRMLENLEDTLPAGAGLHVSGAGFLGAKDGPRVLSVWDVAGRLKGSARERFLEHCRGLVHSLRVEIAGLEQLVVALDGDQDDASPTAPERERQRRTLEHEIERLRAHVGEIDSAIRLCTRDGGDDAG